MLKQKSLFYSLIAVSSLLAGCSGLPGLVTETDTTGTGGSNATDTTTEADSPSGEGESEILAYIPPPSNDGTIITAPDSQGVSYLMGTNLDSEYILVAEWDDSTSSREHPGFFARLQHRASETVAYLWDNLGVNTCHAQTSSATTDVCDAANATCIDIEDDGSAEGPLSGLALTSSVRLSYMNRDSGEIVSEVAEDQPLENVVYLADVPAGAQAVAEDDGELYFVTEGAKLVKMTYDESEARFKMNSGSIADGYLLANAPEETKELDLDTVAENRIAITRTQAADGFGGEVTAQLLNGGALSQFGDASYECWDTTNGCTSRSICSEDDGCSPTMVKVRGGKVYFGTSFTSAKTTGAIKELYNNSTDAIEFINTQDSDQLLTTYAFDVSLTTALLRKEYLVAFRNQSNEVKIYGYYKFPGAIRKTLTIGSVNDVGTVLDITITQEQDRNNPQNGEAALLTSNKLSFIDYNLVGNICTSCTVNGILISSELEISNPVSMAINTEKTYAFVLSNGGNNSSHEDDYITIIDLAARQTASISGLTNSDGQILLSTLLSGKSISDFNPSVIQYFKSEQSSQDYLVVGSDSLRSSIVVLLEGI